MSLKTYEPHKSSIGGMDANLAAFLAYLISLIMLLIGGAHWFAWILPLIFFLMEKNSMLVKFHAAQAFILAVVAGVIFIILDAISWSITWGAVGSVLATGNIFALTGGWVAVTVIAVIVTIFIVIFEILAMVNAYKYKEYNIPGIGGLAEKFAAKMNKNS